MYELWRKLELYVCHLYIDLNLLSHNLVNFEGSIVQFRNGARLIINSKCLPRSRLTQIYYSFAACVSRCTAQSRMLSQSCTPHDAVIYTVSHKKVAAFIFH